MPRSRSAPRADRRRAVIRRRARAVRWRVRLAAAVAVVLLLAAIPLSRRAAAEGWARVEGAMAAAREAEAHERELWRFARQYGISREMAAAVHRAALAERIDPELAFRLVRVESAFVERAVSPVGALGLTQLMPATADELQPGITREQILHRDTNLRLGFRYFRRLHRYYRFDTRAALLAYNRGIGTVDRIRSRGGDPANGYATKVLGAPGASRVRATTDLPQAPLPDSAPLHEMAPARLAEGM